MEHWVRPGGQCVCIDDDWDAEKPFPGWAPSTRVPMINEILTIKEVIEDHPLKAQAPSGVLLTFEELGHDDCFPVESFAALLAEPSDPDNLDYGSEYDG